MLAAANRASLVILQVMSGRSVGNSVFENPGAGSLRPWTAPPERKARHAEIEYSELYLREGKDFIAKLLDETRRNYLAEYDLLLSRIKVPVLLFWFSTRGPDYTELYVQGTDRPAGGFLGSVSATHQRRDLQCVDGQGKKRRLVHQWARLAASLAASADGRDGRLGDCAALSRPQQLLSLARHA